MPSTLVGAPPASSVMNPTSTYAVPRTNAMSWGPPFGPVGRPEANVVVAPERGSIRKTAPVVAATYRAPSGPTALPQAPDSPEVRSCGSGDGVGWCADAVDGARTSSAAEDRASSSR